MDSKQLLGSKRFNSCQKSKQIKLNRQQQSGTGQKILGNLWLSAALRDLKPLSCTAGQEIPKHMILTSANMIMHECKWQSRFAVMPHSL